MTIDITKNYKTRDGRAVTGLRVVPGDPYPYAGMISGFPDEQSWGPAGEFYIHTDYDDGRDLIPVETPATRPGLITPDPLRLEYGAFVSAVRVNFAAGTFATATQEQFDAWLQALTPSLAR